MLQRAPKLAVQQLLEAALRAQARACPGRPVLREGAPESSGRQELRPGEKEQKVELAFTPTPAQVMLVPCIWDRWSAPGKRSILSFAAITDEPPPEAGRWPRSVPYSDKAKER